MILYVFLSPLQFRKQSVLERLQEHRRAGTLIEVLCDANVIYPIYSSYYSTLLKLVNGSGVVPSRTSPSVSYKRKRKGSNDFYRYLIPSSSSTSQMHKWSKSHRYKASDAGVFMSPIPRFSAYLTSTLLPSLPSPPSPPLPHAENFFPFCVLRTASNGKMIGILFLSPADEDKGGDEGIWELAYDLLPAWWGKGVGSGMINAGLEYMKWIGGKKIIAVSFKRDSCLFLVFSLQRQNKS